MKEQMDIPHTSIQFHSDLNKGTKEWVGRKGGASDS